MFDRIAGRYDLLNHLLSGGQDWLWRRRLAGALSQRGAKRVLDIATGTGDQLIALDRRVGGLDLGIGVDVSWNMLYIGEKKLHAKGLGGHLHMVHGDALELPIADASVDAVTISFGIRNVVDVDRAFAEMLRVLKPGGHACILEFGLPSQALLRKAYLLYFRHVLPRFGGMLSGDTQAYTYLNRTVETFPFGAAFTERMQVAGFDQVVGRAMTFGIAYLYIGAKT